MKTNTSSLFLKPSSSLFTILIGLLLCCFSLNLSAQFSLEEELVFHDITPYQEALQLNAQQQQKLAKITADWEMAAAQNPDTYLESGSLYDELAIQHSLRMRNVLSAEQYDQLEVLFLNDRGQETADSYNNYITDLNLTPEQGKQIFLLEQDKELDHNTLILSVLTEEQEAVFQSFFENSPDVVYGERKKEERQMILAVFMALNQEYVNKLREVRTRFNNYLDFTDQAQLDRMRQQRRLPLEPNFEEVRREMEQEPDNLRELSLILYEEFRYAFFQYPRDYQITGMTYENYTWDTLSAQQLVQKYEEQLAPFIPIIHEISREAREEVKVQFEQFGDPENLPAFTTELLEFFHLPTGELPYQFVETFLLMEPLDLADNQAASNQNPFHLEAYPSPARTTQTISFELPIEGQVILEVIDQRGQILKTLKRGRLPAGIHRLDTDVSQWPDGIHFYRLTHPQGISTVKFVVER